MVRIYFPELEEKKSMATEPEEEFDINGTKVMAYSRKDAIKRLKHKK